MRKLIVTEFVTLDGVMEAPGGEHSHPHTGWVFDYLGDEQNEFKFQELEEAEVQLLGRVTYEGFAEAWPKRKGPFADKMNGMPKYVATTTLDELEWENSTPIKDDIPGAVRRLKKEDGGPILVAGSCSLVHTLMEHDLIDELRLMVFPVVLGSGLKVFPESQNKTTYKLADSKRFETGVQVHTYEPVRG